MDFLKFFRQQTNAKQLWIGIGVDKPPAELAPLIAVCKNILQETSISFLLVGKPQVISDLLSHGRPLPARLETLSTESPYSILISDFLQSRLLISDQDTQIPQIHAIIRGSLSSATFLQTLAEYKTQHPPTALLRGESVGDREKGGKTIRLALLETGGGQQFFYGGVGIDEISSLSAKKRFLKAAINFFLEQGWAPKVALLSGGRASDIGRDRSVDRTIREAMTLEDQIHAEYPSISIKHHEILIESAIEEAANIIIAPEGISGNLVYRTLVHLGRGKSYGAIYLDVWQDYGGKVIIDCSRVAPPFELEGAIYLAAGLTKDPSQPPTQ